jgi:hypothetical protein
MLQFGGIAGDQIERYLVTTTHRSEAEARLAASFSNGSLSAALAFEPERVFELRQQALRFVRLLFQPGTIADLSPIAAAISKDKEGFPPWLDAVSMILRDVYFARVSPRRVSQQDILEELQGLAVGIAYERLVSGIEGIKKLRHSLLTNANRQIALESLYLAVSRT